MLKLKKEGFSNLAGLDPFIKEDIDYRNGVKVVKKELSDFNGQFDFILLNSSLKSKLKIVEVKHESSDFQFWGSEQYLRDIPFKTLEGKSLSPKLFSKKQLKYFKKETQRLNKINDGDTVAFLLQK